MQKTCQNCKAEFNIDGEDLNFYERMKVPSPTFCPMCRFQRRIAVRNERKLFKVNDAFTGKPIFSLYPPDAGYKVVTQEEWFSDSWDPMEYGRDYDFSRPFFEQFFELEKVVPVYNQNAKLMVNSDYSANASGLKNCYLCFNSNYSEDCMYGNAIDRSRNCVDNSHVADSELCYESFWLGKCYECHYCSMNFQSRNLWFCRDCLDASDCFGCTNLRKSSYCIFNVQYTKEEYFKELEKMKLDTFSGIEEARKKAHAFWKTQPNKYHQGLKNVNSTGSYVSNSKNVRDSYFVRESENLCYCQYLQVPGNKDCYDCYAWGEHTELSYETSVSGENSYNLRFCFDCWPNVRDSEYCMRLKSSSDCFGCVGLKSKKYCIFNKQYTKESFDELRTRIIQHMNEMPYVDKKGCVYKYGEFFPISFSPFGYNNTPCIEHFPMTKKECEDAGYPWTLVARGEYAITKKASELPDAISDIDDSILKEVIECGSCKHAYRILPAELNFLRRENLPIPRFCVDCRHADRISQRLKIKLHERSCDCVGDTDEIGAYKNSVSHDHGGEKCTNKFQTGFDPKDGDIVYCETCYQQEVA